MASGCFPCRCSLDFGEDAVGASWERRVRRREANYGNNSSDMLEKGWSKRTLNVGDNITVTVEPVKNGKPVGRLLEVVLPNGQTLGMAYLKK
jgi:hypothetical protein